MERQAIAIKYPQYAYELQVDQYGEFEYWDAGNNVEAFYPYIRNKSGKIGYYNYAWRIVRTSDNVVIAQSKASVATPNPDGDASEPLPVADETITHISETVNGKTFSITQNARGDYNVTQPGNVWTVATLADLPCVSFKAGQGYLQSTLLDWQDRHPLCDINGHAIKSAQKPRSAAKRGSQVRFYHEHGKTAYGEDYRGKTRTVA